MFVLEAHVEGILSINWSPDGTKITTGSTDRSAKIWDANTGVELRSLEGHTDDVKGLVKWSPDGSKILTASRDRTARIWDSLTGQSLHNLGPFSDWILDADWSPDASLILTGDFANTARMFSVDSGQELYRITAHTSVVRSVAWSPDGQEFATASDDGQLMVWDTTSGINLFTFHADSVSVDIVNWSNQGGKIISGGSTGTARVWNILEYLSVVANEAAVDWSPDGKLFAVGSGTTNSSLTIWKPSIAEKPLRISPHTDLITSVSWSPRNDKLATSSWDGTVKVWDVESGINMLTIEGHDRTQSEYSNRVNSVEWSPDGRKIVTASEDHTARIWDVENGAELLKLDGHGKDVNYASWSPDGSLIITTSDDRTARIWNSSSGTEVYVLKDHNERVASALWSPNGSLILTTDFDGIAIVWDAQTFTVRNRLSGHQSYIYDADWSPNSTRAVTISIDDTLRIWDVINGKELLVLDAREGNGGVSWSPTGQYLAAGINNGIAIIPIWQTLPELLQFAHECCVPRTLSESEREALNLSSGISDNVTEDFTYDLFDSFHDFENGYFTHFIENIMVDLSDEDNWSRWEYFDGIYSVFVAGTTIHWGPGAEEDECGFLFRRQDSDNYHTLRIDREGDLRFVSQINDDWQDSQYGKGDAIQRQSTESNELMLVATDDTFSVYINGGYASQFSDNSFPRGRVALFASTFDESDETNCTFTNSWVWVPNIGTQVTIPTPAD